MNFFELDEEVAIGNDEGAVIVFEEGADNTLGEAVDSWRIYFGKVGPKLKDIDFGKVESNKNANSDLITNLTRGGMYAQHATDEISQHLQSKFCGHSTGRL